MNTCPSCNSLSTVEIFYGKPSIAVERAAARGLLQLGGCSVSEADPTHRCLDCGNGWRILERDPFAVSDSDSLLNEASQIFDQHLHSIFTGMVAAAIFSDRTASWSSVYVYLRLKEIFEISRGCQRAAVDAASQFHGENPETFARLMRLFTQQISLKTLTGESHDGLYGATFRAAAIILLASPLTSERPDSASIAEFENLILTSGLHIE